MRSLHRDIGFLIIGMTLIYCIGGVIMIFRDRGFLRQETRIEKTIAPGIEAYALGESLHIKSLKVLKIENNIVFFKEGTYNRTTGAVNYTKTDYPAYVKIITDLHVLKGIDLHIEQGDYVSIMGASGSGKSTLLNILGILDNYDTGDYYLNNKLIKDLSETQAAAYRNEMIGFVFQSFNLINFKNAMENVALPLYYKNVSRKKRNAMIKKIILIGLIFLPLTSFAQKAWTLEQCVDTAWNNNLKIRQQQNTAQNREINYRQARLNLLPNLNGSIGQSLVFGRSLTAANTYASSNSKQTSLNLSSNVTLFDGLKMKYNIDARKADWMASKADLEKIRKDIALSVATAYMNFRNDNQK